MAIKQFTLNYLNNKPPEPFTYMWNIASYGKNNYGSPRWKYFLKGVEHSLDYYLDHPKNERNAHVKFNSLVRGANHIMSLILDYKQAQEEMK